jgi:sugar phosphate permease
VLKEGALGGPAAPARKKESSLVVLKSRDVWLLGIIGLGLSVNEFSLFSYYVLYLKEHMLFSVVTAGFLLGVVDAGGVFGKPVSGIISDRLFHGRRKEAFIILAATATLFTVVIALLPVGTPQWILLVCSFVWGFAAVGWAGVWFTMSGEFGGKEHSGFVTGFTTAISTLAPVLGVPAFGYLADKTGTWTWSWVYAVAMAALATVLLFFVREERKALKV